MTQLREQQHITKERFDNWQQGKLNSIQEQEFLKHTGTCTFCAEKFGNWMEEELAMEPPLYLQEEISKRTRQLDVQTALKVKQTSKKVQLFMYSLRVGLAVIASIFLLMVTANVQRTNVEFPVGQPSWKENDESSVGLIDKLNQGSNSVTNTLNEMTNGLFGIDREDVREQK